MPEADVVKIVANGGAFLVLAWLVRHTFQHTIPRIVEQFTQALKEQQAVFREELREERESHKEETRQFWANLGGRRKDDE